MREGGMYQYWTLRYIPNSIRGEFVNVGVIVARGDDWAVRTSARIPRVSSQALRSALQEMLRDIESRLDLQETPSFLTDESRHSVSTRDRHEWISWFAAHSKNALQVAGPSPVEAASAEEGLRFLFPLLVDEPELERASGTKRARGALRSAFDSVDLPSRSFRTRVRLTTGRQETSFDFEVGRDSVRQLAKAWSFERRDPKSVMNDIRSWSFVLDGLRNDGGKTTSSVVTSERTRDVDPNTPVRVLYVPPINSQQREVFEAAQEAWDRVGAEAHPLGQEHVIAREAVVLLNAA